MQVLQYTAAVLGGSGQWDSCHTLPHCLEVVGSASLATACLIASGQWAVKLMQCTASQLGGRGQWNSCNTLPHCLEVVGSGTSAIHCLPA